MRRRISLDEQYIKFIYFTFRIWEMMKFVQSISFFWFSSFSIIDGEKSKQIQKKKTNENEKRKFEEKKNLRAIVFVVVAVFFLFSLGAVLSVYN